MPFLPKKHTKDNLNKKLPVAAAGFVLVLNRPKKLQFFVPEAFFNQMIKYKCAREF
jgi:hypothetical protein